MLRGPRIIGIVAFAILVGISGNSLMQMYHKGILFHQYNYGRKANVTALCVSVLALAALSYMEVASRRPRRRHSGFGGTLPKLEKKRAPAFSREATNIYSAPKSIDDWQGRRETLVVSTGWRIPGMKRICIGLLKVCCGILPFFYFAVMVMQVVKGVSSGSQDWLLISVSLAMFLLSLGMCAAVYFRHGSGSILGYVLAVCSLVVFPIGTFLGMAMLLAMTGSSTFFKMSRYRKRHATRSKTAQDFQSAIV